MQFFKFQTKLFSKKSTTKNRLTVSYSDFKDAFVRFWKELAFVEAGTRLSPSPIDATLARMEAVLGELDAASLAALHTLASLAASLIIGLAALAPDAEPEALWQASELEEEWQAQLWGRDAEAEDRSARRFATFKAAMRFAGLAKG